VVHVARDAEILHRLGGPESAAAVIRQRGGGAYDPRLAETFARCGEQLLARLDERPAWDAMIAAERGQQRWLGDADVDDAIRATADFADLKSHHTGGHSSGVAQLAAEAATQLKLPAEDVTAIRQAGWLHDLGRAGVSAGIWSKPGTLTDAEWERVRLHAYYTERVLARLRLPGGVATLAALHHERLDGSGYHRGAAAGQMPSGARVLAAADAYHAMLESRPHRPAYTAEAAADMLRRDVQTGRLDGEAVGAVLEAAGHRGARARREWPAALSSREVEVLRLAARGLSRREISARLWISERTAGHHLQHIYDKIGVSTRAAATLFAAQHDLLGSDTLVQ
jgi:HD-GYP domain-containing protein (c-di-GMP phosphodiesterase class II)